MPMVEMSSDSMKNAVLDTANGWTELDQKLKPEMDG